MNYEARKKIRSVYCKSITNNIATYMAYIQFLIYILAFSISWFASMLEYMHFGYQSATVWISIPHESKIIFVLLLDDYLIASTWSIKKAELYINFNTDSFIDVISILVLEICVIRIIKLNLWNILLEFLNFEKVLNHVD